MNLKKLSLVLVIVLCCLPWSAVQAQDGQTLTVFAAASLTDAFEAIADAFEAEHPDIEVIFNFAGSSTLATQLTEGAPADVFASANNKQMGVAQEAGRIAGSPLTFAKNRLVVITPADNPADLQSLDDLAKDGVMLVVAAPEVPVRAYTDTMLELLAAAPEYGEDYRAAVVANIISEEADVRQVAAKVALGEADAGVVYLSDVTPDIAGDVAMITIPDAYNTIATYPIAVTDDTEYPEAAQMFVDFVMGDAGQDLLVYWGFVSVRIEKPAGTITIPTDGALHVEGQVVTPLALSAADLQANYAAQTVEVTMQKGDETITSTYTGVLVWDLLTAAQLNADPNVKNDKVSMFIVATASDGYQVALSWGEVDPDYGNQPIMVAYEKDGEALDGFQLVVPGDSASSRFSKGLVSLSVRDVPTAE